MFNASVAEGLEVPKVALASWNFHEVSAFLCLSLFILLILLMKYAYHKIPCVAAYIPESLILIAIGLVFGAIVWYVPQISPTLKNVRLTPTLFFNILLPPIVLEASYSLFNRTFATLFFPIMVFAVIGTVLNFLLIGFGMYGIDVLIGLGSPPLGLTIQEHLLFASLIVAVDPVAVLAIFQDIGVEMSLYYMVFGESLLNDAVTVVLYNIMNAFVAAEHVGAGDICIGIGSFFTVSLGGAFIGLLHGIFTCFLTRLTALSGALPIVIMAYISYMVGDLFGWSGIISMIVCGVFQAAYAFHNIAPLQVLMLKSAVGQFASISEAVIFLFLGLEVMATDLIWHTGFIITALVLCLVVRTLITFVLSAVLNHNKPSHSKIHWTEQIIISYGGLRGAVAFSLVILVNAKFLGPHGEIARDVFITTTLAVILFTVGFMGMTMKPLVRLLNIRLASQDNKKLLTTLNNSIISHTMAYVETLLGEEGTNRIRQLMYKLDDRYIRPVLQTNAMPHNQKIVKVYEKFALNMHTEAIKSRSKLDEEGETDEAVQTAGNENAEEVRKPKPRMRRLPTTTVELLEEDRKAFDDEDAENDDIFTPAVDMHMPRNVRKRLNIASLYQDHNSDLFMPQASLYHKANDAHFRRFSRGQHELLEVMSHRVRGLSETGGGHAAARHHRGHFARTMSADSAATPEAPRNRPRFARHRTAEHGTHRHLLQPNTPEVVDTGPEPVERQQLSPRSPHRYLHARGHHFPRVTRGLSSTSFSEV